MPANDVFHGVFGHEAAKTVLTRALQAPQNAYCFTGPEGVGRHLLAEHFVRGLLGIGTPHALQAHPDCAVLERVLNEAGTKKRAQITVEAVRELRLRMSERPAVAPRLVAYVPEADALNEEGVNALLKCIEEPRAGSVFVFVASQESRLPDTFWSRVHRIRLTALLPEQAEAWMDQEKIPLGERNELRLLAEGKPGLAKRYMDDASFRERLQNAERVMDACIGARNAGEAFAAIREQAEEADSHEDAVQAWRDTIHFWGHALRRRLSASPEPAAHLGGILLAAARAIGGPVSPRIYVELGLVRMAEGRPPVFPAFISQTFPYPIDL